MSYRGVYIHIPFCEVKCNYCSFFSVVLGKDDQIRKKYVKALLGEMELLASAAEDKTVQSIYIGGGTPSILPASDIVSIMEKCFALFDVVSDAECTIEINPATVDAQKIKAYRDCGINRVSIGSQSFFDKSLKFLGRPHNREDIFNAVDICRKADIKNISLDLMFAYKGQTVSEWKQDIKTAVEIEPQHISLYDLSVEEGCRFFDRKDKDLLVLGEDEYLKMYDAVVDMIGSKYIHYEISNFALKKENISRHNMLYWGNLDYFGIGAGAFFYRNGFRGVNEKDLLTYCDKVKKGIMPVAEQEKLDRNSKLKETFVLNLRRLCQGASFADFGEDDLSFFDAAFEDKLKVLKKENMLEEKEGVWFLTRKGIVLFNQVAVMLI